MAGGSRTTGRGRGGSVSSPDPQPGQFWSTSKGRTVEILARNEVGETGDWDDAEIDTVAYKFLGGTMIHLRSVESLREWKQATFE